MCLVPRAGTVSTCREAEDRRSCYRSAMGTTVSVSFENLGKRFDDRVVFKKLRGQADPGEILALSGPNGSGKSTLISILCGLLRPTRGAVRYRHHAEIPREEWRLYLGIVAPAMNLYEELTGFENLKFFSRLRRLGLSEKALCRRMEDVGLEASRSVVVRGYSTGMQQRLKIAQAVLHDPPVLFLDEPGSNLDPAGQDWLQDWVQSLADSGKTVILATNDRRELQWGTRHVILPG